jgi:NADH dehydrogenase (ubiquinone) Fe-S protein 6
MLSPLRRSATDSIRYRSFATSSATALPIGFFARPPVAPQANVARVTRGSAVAKPHTPPNVPKTQAPNKEGTWSESQNPRDLAMRGPRFEQVTFDLQPLPLSAMEMVSREPIRLTQSRTATCDGGELFPAMRDDWLLLSHISM